MARRDENVQDERMSASPPTVQSAPGALPDGDWTLLRPGQDERRWFLRHGLLRGLFWAVPCILAALLWVFWFEVPVTDSVPAGFLGIGFLLLLAHLLWGVLYPRRWLVAIGEREVVVERGILFSTRVFVPFDRVQQVDVVTTPAMAGLNLTELLLQSSAGGVRIYALGPEDAATILDRVRINQPLVPLMRR